MTTTLTCSHLYAADPTFVSAVNKWVADRRCPIELGDYLDEMGLADAADCARWCTSEPDRPSYRKPSMSFGPFPELNNREGVDLDWYWHSSFDPEYLNWSNSVPGDRLKVNEGEVRSRDDRTPHAAIVWLLDNWIGRS